MKIAPNEFVEVVVKGRQSGRLIQAGVIGGNQISEITMRKGKMNVVKRR